MPQCSRHVCLAVVSSLPGCLVTRHPSLECQPEAEEGGRGGREEGESGGWQVTDCTIILATMKSREQNTTTAHAGTEIDCTADLPYFR